MSNASNEFYYASTLQYDVVNQVNPTLNNNNKFIHFPICPREETSKKGIMLTSATINKSLPLINKVGNDNYAVDEHTNGREIFLHVDALSVSDHSKLYMRIQRNLSGISNEDCDITLVYLYQLTTSFSYRKDCFTNRSIHAIFIQPMQVANGVKRVMSDLAEKVPRS